MTLILLRTSIAAIWLGALAIGLTMTFVAPLQTENIKSTQLLLLVPSVAGIWLPGLACFGTFWFCTREQQKRVPEKATVPQARFAIAITVVTMLATLALLGVSLFGGQYAIDSSGDNAGGETVTGNVAKAVAIWSGLSTIPLAIVGWLTATGDK